MRTKTTEARMFCHEKTAFDNAQQRVCPQTWQPISQWESQPRYPEANRSKNGRITQICRQEIELQKVQENK